MVEGTSTREEKGRKILTKGAVLYSPPVALILLCARATSLQSANLFTRKVTVGPRGVRAIRRLMFPTASLPLLPPFASFALFCENKSIWLTPRGPHIVKKSRNLFDFLSRKRLAVFGSITCRTSETRLPTLVDTLPLRITNDLGDEAEAEPASLS
jgi:hypothetical protein